MNDPVHAEKYKGYTIEIYTDDNPESPRENDNIGTMVCFHGSYDLGDKGHGYTQDGQSSWAELEEKLIQDGAAIVLPLYLYDHGGITISTGEFSCPWDSGQVGFVFVTKAKLHKEYGKRITKKVIATATGCMEGEVKEYDNYLTGNIYGYKVLDEDGLELDSCWGYYGDYDDEYGALVEAKSAIDSLTQCEYQARFKAALALTGLEE